ncbi:hypothetical protein LQ938_10410 [Microbacterium sp. cx-55]|uniref:hypothetical protein n=1 Tax=Microbacterium sp. cx-55 TaxID=2875948 RepID=UPI001CC01ED3|nr:hypothetical protein [Microbacterium sp. cx-55]MBZ4485826.1 hypothetical protein [Microbacterium sp. cx-55]UGB34294.1 hypothetical protein LQ938_10410 [Microbacterium sp. cx-55]
MDVEWVAVIAGGVSALVAVVAVVVAVAANRRASTANALAAKANGIAEAANRIAVAANLRADEAHDLQRLVDDREREFRDVSWRVSWSPWEHESGMPALQLTNTGLTPARQVTLVIILPRSQQAIDVGDVAPDQTRTLAIQYGRPGPAHQHIELIRDPVYRIHWSSPLGHPEEVRNSANQLG